ncbi:hypothetical protein E2562_022412 [Oryza meyeriana var. granulata]|uniref:AAA-type ATPase N-terminal domain-containing protein n=1 Tax=Oryza meyeriana var. granulata TaxID=110450 RepID=A0A6G1BMY6_9ORYZ|nr:hypothetical protein E2562_022412 [Oryza meyeriana var. granulata]
MPEHVHEEARYIISSLVPMITVPEYSEERFRRNMLFDAISVYLSSVCLAGASKLKAELGYNSKDDPLISLDENQEVADHLDGGVRMWWKLCLKASKKRGATIISFLPGDEEEVPTLVCSSPAPSARADLFVGVGSNIWYQSQVMAGDKTPVGTPMSGVSGSGGGGTAMATPRSRVVAMQYPMLNDTNYGVWAVKMKIILCHLGVWAAVMGEVWESLSLKEKKNRSGGHGKAGGSHSGSRSHDNDDDGTSSDSDNSESKSNGKKGKCYN